MPEECTVNSSSSTPNSWWDQLHHVANSISSSSSSWCYHHYKNPNLNPTSSRGDEVSFSATSITNASKHSALTAADQCDSSDDLLREHHGPPHNHLWSNLLLHSGNGVDLHNSTKDFEEQILMDPLTSRNSSNGNIFEPPCDDYLKKMGNNSIYHWSNYTDQFRHGFDETRFDQQGQETSLCSTISDNRYKQTIQEFSVKNEECFYNGLNGSIGQADHSQYISGMFHAPCASSRSFLDIRRMGRLTDISPGFKPSLKSLDLSDFNKNELKATSPTTKTLGITREGKNKRSEDYVMDEVSKKPKNGNSDVLPPKEPKIKLRDKVGVLQQIVSPFGKTDTASVLQEAITYIRFLQEQVKELLSNPYMKNSHKDQWRGSWDRADIVKAETKHSTDLRSKGLCLVPVSCTPQDGSEDYWGPGFRGCLYR